MPAVARWTSSEPSARRSPARTVDRQQMTRHAAHATWTPVATRSSWISVADDGDLDPGDPPLHGRGAPRRPRAPTPTAAASRIASASRPPTAHPSPSAELQPDASRLRPAPSRHRAVATRRAEAAATSSCRSSSRSSSWPPARRSPDPAQPADTRVTAAWRGRWPHASAARLGWPLVLPARRAPPTPSTRRTRAGCRSPSTWSARRHRRPVVHLRDRPRRPGGRRPTCGRPGRCRRPGCAGSCARSGSSAGLWIVAQGIAGGSSDGDVATLFLWVYGWVGLAHRVAPPRAGLAVPRPVLDAPRHRRRGPPRGSACRRLGAGRLPRAARSLAGVDPASPSSSGSSSC